MKVISKTLFLSYLTCPKDAWFRLHKPELEGFEEEKEANKHRYSQGYVAEDYAKQLNIFSGLKEVVGRGGEAKAETDALIAAKTPTIFQASFIADGFVIRCDFLKWNSETGQWDLYEMKSSSEVKTSGDRDHITDAAFQMIVLERYGLPTGRTFIVHMHKEYVRRGELDIEALFTVEDRTTEVSARRISVAPEMTEAKEYLNQETEPKTGCDCSYYGRSSHCVTTPLSHPEIPEYSVHDLAYIGRSSARLRALIEEGIYHLHDVKDVSDLSERQRNQIQVHRTDEQIIKKKEIANVLAGYKYPLYFLDYETFAPAVPVYDGYHPRQRIPIQFSLHYIETPGGELKHAEYLHLENSDPSDVVAKGLCDLIDPSGTVLAWHASFEAGVTAELAARVPGYKDRLLVVCDQIQDLEDIFIDQHYVHAGFRGRTAIESIMNALLPEMSYEHLPYTGEQVGFVWWGDIVSSQPAIDRDEKIRLIVEYCKQDTYVMVEIWRILKNIASGSSVS